MKNTRRDYDVSVTIWDSGRPRFVPHLKIPDATEDAALAKTLAYFQRMQRRARKLRKSLSPGILWRHSKGGRCLDEMFRLRTKLRPRDILAAKDPRPCFVRGYGPKALKELDK
ncbi:MAG: hypothetical protein WC767_01195 [Candidatus Paceibacterota bacterium]|jgi:hypothetical protein